MREALDLPDGFNPRTIAWARAFRDDPALRGAKAQQLANALLQHIRTEGFTYTLAPGEYGRNGVDEFWLDRKEGFCEHFASAFVVVMRAIGVPARIVTGYQGTDLPPSDGYYIVRQSSAHAWAEYWQSGVGWIRADPTGAVAPDRITRSSRLAPQPGFVAGTLDAMSPQLFARLRGSWEAINNRWNQWVLNYSRGQQLDVLKQIGFSSPTWEDLALLLVAALSGLALAGAVWAWLDRHRVDPWVRQLERIKRALRALGVAAAAHEPPRTLAARVRERLGSAGEPLAALLDALETQRYSRAATKRPDRALTRDFTTQARRLRRERGSIIRALRPTFGRRPHADVPDPTIPPSPLRRLIVVGGAACALPCAACAGTHATKSAGARKTAATLDDNAPDVVTYGRATTSSASPKASPSGAASMPSGSAPALRRRASSRA